MYKKILIVLVVIVMILNSNSILASNFNAVSLGSSSEWAESELENANNNGLIPELFANCDLTRKITRKEFAYIAVRLYEVLSGARFDFSPKKIFKDVEEPEIAKAYVLGITHGTSDDLFSPNNLITREELTTMMARVLETFNIPPYVDEENLSIKFQDHSELAYWSISNIYFMSKQGIIKGMDNNKFNPKGNATIEQSILIANRINNEFNNIKAQIDESDSSYLITKSYNSYNTPERVAYGTFTKRFGEYSDMVIFGVSKITYDSTNELYPKLNKAHKNYILAHGLNNVNLEKLLLYELPTGYDIFSSKILADIFGVDASGKEVAYVINDSVFDNTKNNNADGSASYEIYDTNGEKEYHFITSSSGRVFTLPGIQFEQKDGTIEYHINSFEKYYYVTKGSSNLNVGDKNINGDVIVSEKPINASVLNKPYGVLVDNNRSVDTFLENEPEYHKIKAAK